MKENRVNEVADYVGKHNNVSIKDLASKFNVSIFTIRRDIDELVARGIIVKHYGGVSINNKSSNTLIGFEDRNTIRKAEKQKISRLAASFVEDNDIIFIDAGTTTMYMPEYIKDKNITVVTNNIYVIFKLFNVENINLIVLGGEVDKRTNSITGYHAINFLQNLNITKSFIASSGISLDSGLTNYTVIEAEIKRHCLETSNKTFLLVDNSKFGQSSLVKYGKISQVDMIITDQQLSKEYYEFCVKNDVGVTHE